MLPFLKKTQDASASIPTDKIERKPDHEQEYDEMESAAEDLCNAIHAKDYKMAAEALRAAFEMMDSQPHKEGPHV
jgi:hypothetical protein